MSDITHEQLEHGHDSNAYALAVYDADQDESVEQPSTNNPIFNPLLNKEKAIEHNEHARQEREAARNRRNKSGSSEAEEPPTSSDADGETHVQTVLPDIRDVQQSAIASADIKFYLAAPNNAVLNELRIMCQQENIPPALRDRPALLLRLCADYGIDEENDAEAIDYLEHIKNGSSSHQNTDDPVNAVWQETLTAYEAFKADTENEVAEAVYKSKLEAYQALVETIYALSSLMLKAVRLGTC